MGFVMEAGEKLKAICDRFWMFTIAAMSLAVIGFILGAVVINGKMPEGAGELFAASITGLLLIVQKVIDAQQQRRLSDQLHNSQPVATAPQSAVDAARATADAAERHADQIEDRAR